MSYQTLSGLTLEQLEKQVPRKYDHAREGMRLHTGLYTLIQFAPSKDQIVLSRTVREALAKIPDDARIVAVAYGFTTEGLDCLAARGAVVLTESEFYWTDESYERIRRDL